ASLLYKSKDLINWEYLNPLCIGNEKETGRMWKCPDFFPLGDKHLLLVSVNSETLYLIGTYAEHEFQIERKGKIDGGNYYAAKSMPDERGRRILFGWIMEGRSTAAQWASGWAGVQALPRTLSLREDGVLNIEPVPELKILRNERYEYGDLNVKPDSYLLLEGIQEDCLEVEAELEPGDAEKIGLKVHCTFDSAEETLIFYNRWGKSLNVDRERSSLHPDVFRELQEAPLEL
ncbi:MAG: glycoside hydrolase family 32 protein, partial [Thermoproteota archaeon]